jgi:CRP-like cAMP-binding protein
MLPPVDFGSAPSLPMSNALLASLSPSDAAAIQPHLKNIDLEHKRVLFEAGDTVTQVYFPTGAVISLVIGLSTGEMIEAAMVGRDGVVGASSALDGRISLSQAIVQLAGTALVCKLGALKGAALQSHSPLSKLIRHEQTLYAQAQQSTACMAAHDVESRLCRWLLRARDLAGSDNLMFHSGISCRDARGAPHQYHCRRSHPAAGRNDQIRQGENPDSQCRGPARHGLRNATNRSGSTTRSF